MQKHVERRLAAIVSVDLVGYSRLMGADEVGTLAALKACRSECIDPHVSKHGGRIVKTMGDGLLLEFPSVVNATQFAIEIQQALAKHNEGTAEDKCTVFRIGVNLGDIIFQDGDIFGDGVNIAARLESMAEPGGICISSRAHEEVRDRLETAFEDLGEMALKNIARPVRVWGWPPRQPGKANPVAHAMGSGTGLPTAAGKCSIAVLPFKNMSGEPEQEYFSDGLTEDITTGLSQFHSLFVIARNSAFSFKDKDVDTQEIGKKLGVSYIVKGSVRKSGNRVRIAAALIDSHSGTNLWAQNFDRELNDIFAVQDEVTRSIVTSLPDRVGAEELKRMRAKRTDQMESYDYFLRGRELHHKFAKADCIEGIQLLEKSVELDPNFAQAWAWHACIVGQAWLRDYLPGGTELHNRCVASAQKALELDEADSECHRILCEVYLLQKKFDEAEYHNERGLSLNQNEPRIVVQRGYLLAYLGRPDEGIEWVKKVLKLDPVNPENYYANFGIVLHAAHLYQQAIDVFKRLPGLQAKYLAYLASCHGHLDQGALAQEQVEKILKLEPGFTVASFASTLRYKKPEDMDHLLDGMRRAGIPEK